jgi:CheY-like chemotaxis protein
VLVAEDDGAMRSMITEWLTSSGYTVSECASAEHLMEDLLRAARKEFVQEDFEPIDLIITDNRMPGCDGLEALESLWSHPLPPIILITAFIDEETSARAQKLDVAAILSKPFHYHDLMITAEWLNSSAVPCVSNDACEILPQSS